MTDMTFSASIYPPRAEINTRSAPYARESKRVSHQHPEFMTLEWLSDIEPRGNPIRFINEWLRVCVYETLVQTYLNAGARCERTNISCFIRLS